MRIAKSAAMTLAAVLLLPLVSMAIIPFYDTSEPRYAEIARVMAQGGDWITPWFSPGIPFWGKPPLSFWAQALSMKAFGFTEFAARLPSWICLLVSVAILQAGVRRLYGPRIAMTSALVYSTCTLAYISSGAVLTDPFLALGTTLSLVAFAVVAAKESETAAGTAAAFMGTRTERGTSGLRGLSWWRYGFFIGLALGLLAKGPLAAVLIGAPALVWRALRWRHQPAAVPLPWVKGLALVAALTLPWYLMAELKTPGFLDYFITGEHFRRFLDPGWQGDLYGTAHRRAHGTIWLYWLQAAFPWSLLVLTGLIGAVFSVRLRLALHAAARARLFHYWLAAALVTPAFFTFSANILWTYLLPSLAGFSVLTALLLDAVHIEAGRPRRLLTACVLTVPSIVLVASVLAWAFPDLRDTERGLVRYANGLDAGSTQLHYLGELPFSARFYSGGMAGELEPAALGGAAACGKPFLLAIPKDERNQVSSMLGGSFTPLYSNRRYILVKVVPKESCPPSRH